MPATCRCGRQWTGLSQAHCPTCHEHFSSVPNFDRHRPGSGGCKHPSEVTKRNGEPAFRASQNRLGITWVGGDEYAGPRTDGDRATTTAG